MAITATRSTVLRPIAGSDQDNDGYADFGDVLRHTLVISNTVSAANGVVVNDPLNGSTLTGVVNISPLALDDSYTAVGNTVLRVGGAANIGSGPSFVSALGNLISNDLGAISGDGVTGFQIIAASGTSAQGGTFNVFADGSFNYVNQAGDTGTDTFTYTITDAGLDGSFATTADNLTSVGTVTITLSGEVWYVDSAAGAGGTGTSANPFNTMSAFSAANVDGANDFVYVKGAATGTLVMESGEQLIGTGASLDVGGNHLADAATSSSVANATGTIVTLNSGNTIAGINIGTGTGTATALSGSAFGTLTIGSNVAIDSGGAALTLTNGAVAGSALTSTNSDGGTTNVNLNTVTGTLGLGSGALAGATGTAFNINAGSVNVTGSATLSQATAGQAMFSVSGGHTGTVQLTGAMSATLGTGAQFNNADGAYDLFGTGTLNGGDAGIDITNGSAGTFNFGQAGTTTWTLTSPTGIGMVIDGSTAAVTYNGNITQANNAATVDINNHSTGTITFQNGAIDATLGTGLQFSNADATYNFTGNVTLHGGDAGVDVDTGSAGTFNFGSSAGAGTTIAITSPTGVGLLVDNSTAAITYRGSITQANNAAAVDVNVHSTGTITFNVGTIGATNGTGLQFSDADGTYTVNTATTLNGGDAGIDIDTGSGAHSCSARPA
jgi:hypothetical protein